MVLTHNGEDGVTVTRPQSLRRSVAAGLFIQRYHLAYLAYPIQVTAAVCQTAGEAAAQSRSGRTAHNWLNCTIFRGMSGVCSIVFTVTTSLCGTSLHRYYIAQLR